jgi:hypothetical protein
MTPVKASEFRCSFAEIKFMVPEQKKAGIAAGLRVLLRNESNR